MRWIWLLCLSLSLCAQTMDMSHLGTGTISLAGLWRFHEGDDPRWADPNFDDSGWELVKVPLSLQKQGYPNFSGYGWYRLELRTESVLAPRDLQLIFGRERYAYEVYANGNKIGRFGSFPPQKRLYDGRLMSFSLPKIQETGQHRLLIAFRFWVPARFASFNAGGLTSGPIEIGTASTIQNRLTAEKYREMWSRLPLAMVRGIMLILAVILIAIYSFDRRPEYLLLGLRFTAQAFALAVSWLATDTFLLTTLQQRLIGDVLNNLAMFFAVYGIWSLLEAPVGRSINTSLFTVIAFSQLTFWAYQGGSSRAPLLDTVAYALGMCFCLVIVVFILWRSRHVPVQTRWLAASFIPFYLMLALSNLLSAVPALAQLVSSELVRSLQNTVSIVTAVAFGYFLLRRFGAARAEQERLHAEMEAARQVQRLMLPAQCVDASYVHIDTAYLPSQEVGGDFYQIATSNDGSVLLIIGDVSGKGLQAALTMSLIVGLWQEVVTTTQSPREILCRFNHYLQRRLSGGFVTCLCARLQLDGQLTIANAGHLAPYLNGTELPVLNGLPLGISAESDYDESHFLLAPADTLVLISDGVVEARDKSHSFYGFERLQQALLERPGAEAIARHAQQFGQEDDITVIAISPRVVMTKSSTAQAALAEHI